MPFLSIDDVKMHTRSGRSVKRQFLGGTIGRRGATGVKRQFLGSIIGRRGAKIQHREQEF